MIKETNQRRVQLKSKCEVMLTTTIAFAFIAVATAQAEVLYDWDFSVQTNGTAMADVSSSGTESPVQFPTKLVTTNLTVSAASLKVNEAGGTPSSAAYNSFADIMDLSSGTYWLVAELSGWNVSSDGGIMDLIFASGDTTADNLAGMRLTTRTTGLKVSSINANGSSLAQEFAVTSNESPLVVAVEINLDTDTTTLHYKYGSGAWAASADQPVVAGLDVSHIRFNASGFDPGNELSLDKIYVSTIAPAILGPIVYEWDFSAETNGTLLADVSSSGTGGAAQFPTKQVTTNLSVLAGSLVVNEDEGAASTGANNAFVDIEDISSGRYWVVAELSGWEVSSNGGIMDLIFASGDTTADNLAGMRLTTRTTGLKVSSINANGSSLAQEFAVTSNESPLVVAVEINLDTDTTTLHYKYGSGGDWASSSEKPISAGLDVSHLRFGASAFAVGDELNVDKIYVSRVHPALIGPVAYEWDFSAETNGTAMADVSSSGTGSSLPFPEKLVTTNLTVTDGSLTVNEAGGPLSGAPYNSFVDIEDISFGRYWLVAELSGWSVSADGGLVTLMFSSGNSTGDNLAGMIFTTKTNEMVASLVHSTGSARVGEFTNLTDSTPVVFALELNRDAGTTTLHFKYG